MGTLTEADDAVRQRLQPVVGAATLTADPPSATAGALTASLYLYEVADELEVRGGRDRAPVRVRLRHLLSVQGQDRHEALELLDQLIGAAIELDDVEVRFDPPDVVFRSLGIAKQPAAVLESVVHYERPRPVVPLVTEPPVVRGTLVRTIRGRVVGPGGIRLGSASVRPEGSGSWITTTSDGAFQVALIPDEHDRARLRVAAKGREFVADLDLSSVADEILIPIDPREV